MGTAAALVVRHCLAGAPTLGRGRLIAIDGPAGSGKSTLADAVVDRARHLVVSVGLIHLDDLYQGWTGLDQHLVERVHDGILAPLSRERTGCYRRWDWHDDAWAEEHWVDPVALLVMEGVGSGARALDHLVTTRVWVEAPRDLRWARGLDRGGVGLEDHWERWLAREEAFLAAEGTRERADILVDGTGDRAPRLRV